MYTEVILKVKLNRKQKTSTSRFVTSLKEITKSPIKKLDKPIFLFKIKNEAAARNSKILAAFNINIDAEIAAQKVSPLNYRSEFYDTMDLSRLF